VTIDILTDTTGWLEAVRAFETCACLIEDSAHLSKPRLSQLPHNDAENKIGVLPSLSDFRCDFELTARDALNDAEFLVFRAAFLKETLPQSAIPAEKLADIKVKVGAMLIKRKIFHADYFYAHSSVTRREDAERQEQQRIAAAQDRRMRRRKAA